MGQIGSITLLSFYYHVIRIVGNSKTETKLLNLNSFNYISNVKGDNMKSKIATTWVRVVEATRSFNIDINTLKILLTTLPISWMLINTNTISEIKNTAHT